MSNIYQNIDKIGIILKYSVLIPIYKPSYILMIFD